MGLRLFLQAGQGLHRRHGFRVILAVFGLAQLQDFHQQGLGLRFLVRRQQGLGGGHQISGVGCGVLASEIERGIDGHGLRWVLNKGKKEKSRRDSRLNEITLFSAFLAGLFGSAGHCIAMCGGIISGLTMGLPTERRRTFRGLLPFLTLYNGGRIASYAVAGAATGWIGAQVRFWFPLWQQWNLALWLSAIFLIVLGLYLGGWWQSITWLERFGSAAWKRIEPLGRRFLPIRTPLQALVVGLVWGWLPCGLVYFTLLWSLTANGPWEGALMMLAFGLGTLPLLIAVGGAAEWITRITRHPVARRMLGALLIVFGLWMIRGG